MRVRYPVLFALVLLGCGPSHNGVDEFSQAFTGFRDAKFDLEVESLLPVYNPQQTPCEQQNYFACETQALDPHKSATERQSYARQAIEVLDGPIKQKMSEFAARINGISGPTTAVTDAVGNVQEDEYRGKAAAVADVAKQLRHSYDQLYVTYAKRFDIQRKILEGLALDGSTLPSDLDARAAEIATLNKQMESLRADSKVKDKALMDTFADYRDTAKAQAYKSKADPVDSDLPPLPNAVAGQNAQSLALPMPK